MTDGLAAIRAVHYAHWNYTGNQSNELKETNGIQRDTLRHILHIPEFQGIDQMNEKIYSRKTESIVWSARRKAVPKVQLHMWSKKKRLQVVMSSLLLKNGRRLVSSLRCSWKPRLLPASCESFIQNRMVFSVQVFSFNLGILCTRLIRNLVPGQLMKGWGFMRLGLAWCLIPSPWASTVLLNLFIPDVWLSP